MERPITALFIDSTDSTTAASSINNLVVQLTENLSVENERSEMFIALDTIRFKNTMYNITGNEVLVIYTLYEDTLSLTTTKVDGYVSHMITFPEGNYDGAAISLEYNRQRDDTETDYSTNDNMSNRGYTKYYEDSDNIYAKRALPSLLYNSNSGKFYFSYESDHTFHITKSQMSSTSRKNSPIPSGLFLVVNELTSPFLQKLGFYSDGESTIEKWDQQGIYIPITWSYQEDTLEINNEIESTYRFFMTDYTLLHSFTYQMDESTVNYFDIYLQECTPSHYVSGNDIVRKKNVLQRVYVLSAFGETQCSTFGPNFLWTKLTGTALQNFQFTFMYKSSLIDIFKTPIQMTLRVKTVDRSRDMVATLPDNSYPYTDQSRKRPGEGRNLL